MLVPFNDPLLLQRELYLLKHVVTPNNYGVAAAGNAAQSPYVIAMTRAGIHTLPSIVNAAIFTSAFSAGNSFLFCASRILYGLSLRGQAPRFLCYCTKNGLPINAVLATVSTLVRIP